jgi:hypothetical protein
LSVFIKISSTTSDNNSVQHDVRNTHFIIYDRTYNLQHAGRQAKLYKLVSWSSLYARLQASSMKMTDSLLGYGAM